MGPHAGPLHLSLHLPPPAVSGRKPQTEDGGEAGPLLLLLLLLPCMGAAVAEGAGPALRPPPWLHTEPPAVVALARDLARVRRAGGASPSGAPPQPPLPWALGAQRFRRVHVQGYACSLQYKPAGTLHVFSVRDRTGGVEVVAKPILRTCATNVAAAAAARCRG